MNPVAMVIVLLLASHVNSSPIIMWDTPRHFCGAQLANVLALICSQGYNFHPNTDDVTVPSRRRKRSPIVVECCENTCTPSHLKSYCWETGNGQRVDQSGFVGSTVEKPSVEKLWKPQKTPRQQQSQEVDNSLLLDQTSAKTISNSIIPNSKEQIRKTNNKYNATPHTLITKPVNGQEPKVPGRVKTVTPYFDKMPKQVNINHSYEATLKLRNAT
ncbi:uncharacterized protein LOC126842020 [Adelges cooleyi]|uniref:uncharacterized protein LOC126842020 n=1 Tax=Adelges cooleyi TaxID=133065 RepID=UPI00217F8192|nr:uncharacterized protein LOC126842020 [Adelges cooleyi]XP_050434831.1 uncharacterized protein LOC126842020 [Adelges cooleyi]XP_050434832.1 uncharacterized protein LOC126842020 [Adelges cooleyi]XP_050434833.1 uncharacterized protein LOC126842020 [Adelges cooleyi]